MIFPLKTYDKINFLKITLSLLMSGTKYNFFISVLYGQIKNLRESVSDQRPWGFSKFSVNVIN